MKKNIVITVLAILVLGMGGYLVYEKTLSNNNEQKEINDDQIKQEKILKDTARALVEKYSKLFSYNFDYILELSEEDKVSMALRNMNYSLVQSSECKEITNAQVTESGQCYIKENSQEYYLSGLSVLYEFLNESYKDLFGDENEASKISTEYGYYDKNTDSYYIVDTESCFGGTYSHCMSPGFWSEFGIKSVTIKDDILTVDIGVFDVFDDDSSKGLKTNLTDEIYEIDKFDTEEKIQKFFEENEDKVDDIYRWVFKQEDGKYVLQSMKKL